MDILFKCLILNWLYLYNICMQHTSDIQFCNCLLTNPKVTTMHWTLN
jgi:hypothetical protein